MGVTSGVGDVFEVRIDDERHGLGVIAAKRYKNLYLVLFDVVMRRGTAVPDVRTLEPLLASCSLDAKLWLGHWPIVGSVESLPDVAQPMYRSHEPDGFVAESFDRQVRIKIDERTADRLRTRKCVAPVCLEKALKAYAGVGDWDPIYDELLYSEVVRSNTVV